ncbi:MAG: ComEC/Rec2 family competence protein [Tenacibaculum sp.]
MKKLLDYLPIHFLLCFIIGIVLGFSTKIYNLYYLLLTILSTIILLYFLRVSKFKRWFTFVTTFTFILLGIFTTHVSTPKNHVNFFQQNINTNTPVVLKITKKLKPGNYYDKYIASVIQVANKKACGYILLNIQKDSTSKLNIDDLIYLNSEIKPLITPLNPYQFNYKDYLAKQYIYHQTFINKKEFTLLNKQTTSVYGLAANFRNKIQSSLQKYSFTKDEYAVINALLLGQRQDISKELLQSYTNAGAIHILAISGLHIGIILLILLQLLKPLDKLKYGSTFKTFLIVILLWMFAFTAGLSASVVRAVTMFTFVAIGRSFKRKKVIEYSLISSMFFLLLIKPMFLFDVGFQLSYLAVFGIIWVQPLLYKLWNPKLKLMHFFWRLFTVSVAAQAGILPISLYYFHQFPGLFIVSNLLIIPFLSAILIGGISIILFSILNILPTPIANIYGWIISLMNKTVRWIGNQERFLLQEISMSFLEMLAWYAIIICAYQLLMHKKVAKIHLLLVTIISLQTVLIFEKRERNLKKEFIVFHQSRKTLLGVRDGKTLEIFTPNDSLERSTLNLIKNYTINQNIKSSAKKNNTNIFNFNNKNLLIIDSLGVYNINIKKPVIILQHSPKINLTRMINTLKPTQIVADGSNYKSYINRWRTACKQQKTPFHYTGKNGAYVINEN